MSVSQYCSHILFLDLYSRNFLPEVHENPVLFLSPPLIKTMTKGVILSGPSPFLNPKLWIMISRVYCSTGAHNMHEMIEQAASAVSVKTPM